MEEYIFTKKFTYISNIKEINNILIDHEFTNKLENDGINIVGDIFLTFIIVSDDKNDYEALKIPVDIFISLNKIDCLKELNLIIDHFDYEIKENEIEFKVYTKLMGNNEEFISFEPTKNREINKAMIDLLMRNNNEEQELKLDKRFLSNIENIITKDNVELISTPYEDLTLNNDDIIEISTVEKKDEQKNDDKIEQTEEKQDTVREKSALIIKEEKDVVIKNDTNNNELFKEKYTSSYFYYRLKENETISSLADLFKINEDDIRRINKNVEFKKGQLIKILK